MKNILFIHQSADLYGSDKTLLFLVNSIKSEYKPIVILPNKGPLSKELERCKIEYHCMPVIKVSRDFFKFINLIKQPYTILKAVYQLKRKIGKREIEIIHSNTIAVFLGAFYCRFHKIKHVWHVHELIKHPKTAAKIYPKLVNYFSTEVVFNSHASAEQMYLFSPRLREKSIVIHNGLDRKEPFLEDKDKLRNKLFKNLDKSSIVIGLVGRINKHKGQQLLLDVFEDLKHEFNNIYLLFIGSTIKSKSYLLEELKLKISNIKLDDYVKIIDFQKDIWKFYDCMDIVTVPTTDPEPFGLVALEGMLAKKPVVASNHGGLKEIIIHNESGLLFKPNNSRDFKMAIKSLLLDKSKRYQLALKGEERAKTIFSLEEYVVKFKKLYNRL